MHSRAPPRTQVRSVDPASYAEAARTREKRILDIRERAEPASIPCEQAEISALSSLTPIVVLFLPPAVAEPKRALSLAALQKELETTDPSASFGIVTHHPPMFDSSP